MMIGADCRCPEIIRTLKSRKARIGYKRWVYLGLAIAPLASAAAINHLAITRWIGMAKSFPENPATAYAKSFSRKSATA